MSEVTEVLPTLSFDNGVLVNYSDLLSVADEYKSLPEIIATPAQGSRINEVKKRLKDHADTIKKTLKAEDKRRSELFYEQNHGAAAALDTLVSVREDLVERTNTWERTRLDANMPILVSFVEEQNSLHGLDKEHELKASEWRKLGTFTATGKVVNKVQNEIVMRARLAENDQNALPKLSELDIYKAKVLHVFSNLFEEFKSDELYSGKDFQKALSEKSAELK